jgi:hypothetical protein
MTNQETVLAFIDRLIAHDIDALGELSHKRH